MINHFVEAEKILEEVDRFSQSCAFDPVGLNTMLKKAEIHAMLAALQPRYPCPVK